MSYLVLARKWRPRNFREIVGQEHVIRALTNALESGRLHHAYLFAGTRGVGKTTIARILAKALNCETGMTADPCGECSACREIDEGRFVDLIEVDAASKTKVDDTRDLLDNVQFAPAGGRFKVYLIDEVHMLTKHSFNALLKTLEEPPPHVKFLLATTDPQKLPVTVLSRCLQFNLTRLTPRLIRDRLDYICKEEDVPAEAAALGMLARAADGSLRDALSLLDQAIAYCGGEVGSAATGEMLGTIDRQYVLQLLRCLAADDAPGLMAALADIDQQFPDYGQLLDDLARALQRIAVFQVVGQDNDDEELTGETLSEFAESIPAADLQLYYQTAITGRRDLRIAPDPRSGAEMTLLRMLAFRPVGSGGQQKRIDKLVKKPAPRPSAAKDAEPKPPAAAAEPPASSTRWDNPDWAALVAELNLQSANRLLASNCALLRRDGMDVHLQLDPSAEAYLTRTRQEALQSALGDYFNEPLKLTISVGETAAETPVQQKVREDDEELQAARDTLRADPNVQNLIDTFGAEMNSDSVRIVDK